MTMDFYTTQYIKDFSDEYSTYTKDKVSQLFLKDQLEKKFQTSHLIQSTPDDLAELLTLKIGGKNYLGGIHTGISGIISPISKDDTNDITNIAMNISGAFGQDIKRKFKDFDKHEYQFSTQEAFEKARNKQIETFFFEILKIPIFKASDYLPGYKENPMPPGKPISYHQTIGVVQTMYSVWLEEIRKAMNVKNK